MARHGFALAAALGALVVVAALAAGLQFAAAQAARAAGQGLAAERALAAAERALADTPALWAAGAPPALGARVGRVYDFGRGDSASLAVTRVTHVTAWASALGTSGGARGRARRGAAMLMALAPGPGGVPVLVPVTRRAWFQTF